ncbi:hypothetical protein [Nonomuraea aurantiaca]|uniref:hypothetical protein n=1 Tax=Nonomuraea aurantiaca TaxID=2878562 RepID=UPI001CD99C08|nr:hypothetical protein [Nonomuraea aurantiaca]MCA2222308.1 hypothetical protein [Nonomuraea aurantiaca]
MAGEHDDRGLLTAPDPADGLDDRHAGEVVVGVPLVGGVHQHDVDALVRPAGRRPVAESRDHLHARCPGQDGDDAGAADVVVVHDDHALAVCPRHTVITLRT